MEKNRVAIGFTGDVAFCDYFADSYKRDDLLDGSVKQFLDSNDYNVINVEQTITPCRFKSAKGNGKRADFDSLEFYKKNIKNPVLSFANNRVMDYSRIGTIDTIEGCKAAGIPYIGIGMKLVNACEFAVFGDDVKVAVLAVGNNKRTKASDKNGGPLFEGDKAAIKETIEKMKAEADYAVVYYHCGDRYSRLPMPYTRNTIKNYMKWGADAVVCTHPHTVQGYEKFGNKLAFYSLGDFIIDNDELRSVEETEKGLLLRLIADRNGLSFETQSVIIDRENGKVLADGEAIREITKEEYNAKWADEAARISDSRAQRALEAEIRREERQLRRQEEREIVQAIQMEAEGKIDETLIEKEKNENVSFNKKFKKVTTKLFGNQERKYRDIVLWVGKELSRKK